MKLLALMLVAAFASFAALGFSASPAAAHPLGNFSINTATQITVGADSLQLHFVLDQAEIPTLQDQAALDPNGDGTVSAAEAAAYLAATTPALLDNLVLTVNGSRAELEVTGSAIVLRPGEAGLKTLRLDLELVAPVKGGGQPIEVSFEDKNFADRAGYHEATVSGGEAVLASDVAAESPTQLLSAPNLNRSSLPASHRSATFSYQPDLAPAGALPPSAVASVPSSAASTASPLTRFIQPGAVTLSTVFLLLAVALGLGALHALEPGHGKSIVAAYFIGTRGSAAQAAMLGLIVAVTHSIGVLGVAVLVLFGSHYFVPEQAYPWLTMLSGVMVLFLGFALLVSRLRSSGLWHRIQHLRGSGHHHHHDHDHERDGHGAGAPGSPPWKALILLGLIDGLVPTPSTLVVLLGAIAVGRIEVGLLMVVAFSVGMALVMASVSLAVLGVRAVAGRVRGRFAPGLPAAGTLGVRAAALLPVGAALILLVVGTTIVIRGAAGLSAL